MTPARLLAPVALVACALALFAVVSSSHKDKAQSESSSSESATATVTATATKSATTKKTPPARTYTVQAGDNPSGIAQKEHVNLQDLLDANPDADPGALTVGEKLKLP